MWFLSSCENLRMKLSQSRPRIECDFPVWNLYLIVIRWENDPLIFAKEMRRTFPPILRRSQLEDLPPDQPFCRTSEGFIKQVMQHISG